MSKVVDFKPRTPNRPKMRYRCVCGCIKFEVSVNGLVCADCEGIHPIIDVLGTMDNPKPPPRG